MPVPRYSACEVVRHKREQSVVAAYGVVPVAAIVQVFTAGTYRQYRGTTTTVVFFATYIVCLSARLSVRLIPERVGHSEIK